MYERFSEGMGKNRHRQDEYRQLARQVVKMGVPPGGKVLDAGATPAGRPFFVMELVKGLPLTEYCDANRLTARERLAAIDEQHSLAAA